MVQASSVVLHFSAVCAMSYGYNALHGLSVNTWITSQYGGHFQFLTVQGLAVAWLTMAVGLLEDFFPSIKGIRAAKRALFIIAMPSATMVSSIYWTLLLTNPQLILQAMPGEGETSSILVLPLRIDFALHLVPCLALLADFMIFERRYGRKATLYAAPALILLSTVWYGAWVEHCAHKNGTFPYPFLTLNPFEIRLRIYAGTGTLACLSFFALNALHAK
ncbi:FAR-17a/AIG1-like protein [Mycena galericulata]|nr:FAR-17a/AIG1-like protein [Mycena galericulata]